MHDPMDPVIPLEQMPVARITALTDGFVLVLPGRSIACPDGAALAAAVYDYFAVPEGLVVPQAGILPENPEVPVSADEVRQALGYQAAGSDEPLFEVPSTPKEINIETNVARNLLVLCTGYIQDKITQAQLDEKLADSRLFPDGVSREEFDAGMKEAERLLRQAVGGDEPYTTVNEPDEPEPEPAPKRRRRTKKGTK